MHKSCTDIYLLFVYDGDYDDSSGYDDILKNHWNFQNLFANIENKNIAEV